MIHSIAKLIQISSTNNHLDMSMGKCSTFKPRILWAVVKLELLIWENFLSIHHKKRLN